MRVVVPFVPCLSPDQLFSAIFAFHNEDWMQLTRVASKISSNHLVVRLLQLFVSNKAKPWRHILFGCKIVVDNYKNVISMPERVLLTAIDNTNCNVRLVNYLISIGCRVTSQVLKWTMYKERLDIMEHFLKGGMHNAWNDPRPIFGCIGDSIELGRLLLKYKVDPYAIHCSPSDHCYAIEFLDPAMVTAMGIRYKALFG